MNRSKCCISDQTSLCSSSKSKTEKLKIKFSIPKHLNYNILPDPKEELTGKCFTKAEFAHSAYSNINYNWIHVECYQTKKYKSNDRITILHVRNKNIPSHNKQTIIYSHGNNDDLGTIYPMLVDLASQLKVTMD
jgi:hypothetical protein